MERAVSSAGIGRTDTDGDAKPTARSLLKIYRFELRGFDPMVSGAQRLKSNTTPLEGWNTGMMEY
jgi:hypothetical protein